MKFSNFLTVFFLFLITCANSFAANHCTPVWDGHPYNSLKLWIVEVEGLTIEANDEICIFDGDNCVGMGVAEQGISYENILQIVC